MNLNGIAQSTGRERSGYLFSNLMIVQSLTTHTDVFEPTVLGGIASAELSTDDDCRMEPARPIPRLDILAATPSSTLRGIEIDQQQVDMTAVVGVTAS
mmetsp:Transcript_12307/g.31125  ORF Transcript_12307/g.31125 Transcript_12307/m.31125 type:complete len:98 (+) Transcript_12307:621-914(+)